MKQAVFSQKSMDRISAPEQLDDYLHVTSPSVWIILAAMIVLLVSLFVWSGTTALENYAAGTAQVRGGVLTLSFDDAEKADNVEVGMNVSVGEMEYPILSIGQKDGGGRFAVAQTALPDGTYEARVAYKSTQILNMLFN